MKKCRVTLPRRDVEGLEEAIRKAMEDSDVQLTLEVGDVDAATVKDCFISKNESATEEAEDEKEVGTAALIDFVQGKITRIEQEWHRDS
jgi:hypothetical protein